MFNLKSYGVNMDKKEVENRIKVLNRCYWANMKINGKALTKQQYFKKLEKLKQCENLGCNLKAELTVSVMESGKLIRKYRSCWPCFGNVDKMQ